MLRSKKLFSIFKNIFRKFVKIPLFIYWNGPIHNLRILGIVFFMPILIPILQLYSIFYRRSRRTIKNIKATAEIKFWKTKKRDILEAGKNGYKLTLNELGLEPEKIHELTNKQIEIKKTVIATIDQDGFWLSHIGPIKNVPSVSQSEFHPRIRFKLDVIAINGIVGVRKNFNGNKASFLKELEALHMLGIAGCNVPAILDIDFDLLNITISYIKGQLLSEALAKKGAIIYDRDATDKNPDFKGLSRKENIAKRKNGARRFLSEVVEKKFIERFWKEIEKIHEARFLINDCKYGNIIIEQKSNDPFLIDFDGSINCSKLNINVFRLIRDHDISAFNFLFNTEKPTYKILKGYFNKVSKSHDEPFYSPAYFGVGLRIGNIWSVTSGYGRWNFILKDNLPTFKGCRILDIGANNAFYSLQMLRSGAKEVIGIEKADKYIEQGVLLKEFIEWLDIKKYNFKYQQADIADINISALDKFDFAMALCSIYYLPDELIAKTIKQISMVTDCLVLQCNIEKNIGRGAQHNYEKASIQYNIEALKNNGFPNIRVIAPKRYSRPLIIGKKQ